jgi:DNA polymerase-3 subunit delta
VAGLAQTLKAFRWDGVRLLISAGKVDRRKAFYKTLEKLAQVEAHAGLSADDRDWAEKAEALAARAFQAAGRRATAEALAALVAQVGPNTRLLASECEKLAVYAGDRPEITAADVEAVGVRAKHARAFALADAVGDRDLPRVLRRLDEELWAMRTDRKRSGIGLLYGLITKVRCLLLARELLREGLLRAGGEFGGFKAQLERLPAGRFAEDDRYNPRRITPYILFRACQQAGRWTTAELVRGMELLLECNRRLVGSQLDDALLLQQLLVALVGTPAARK